LGTLHNKKLWNNLIEEMEQKTLYHYHSLELTSSYLLATRWPIGLERADDQNITCHKAA
jgi:hypothetical protein